ncbi:hypothetical protein CN373_07740 [Bacillus cereus]|nr:hypothetical protein CN373_07740 [Bacillus cereus]PGZ13921.1 hypothetical protein COE46_19600 [Bacillus cereus]
MVRNLHKSNTFLAGQAYSEVWDKRKSLFSYSLKTPYHRKSTFKCSFSFIHMKKRRGVVQAQNDMAENIMGKYKECI